MIQCKDALEWWIKSNGNVKIYLFYYSLFSLYESGLVCCVLSYW